MDSSQLIASLMGPTLVAILVAEFPLVQPRLYDKQIPPVVYLSGTIFFFAGLVVVRFHNLWVPDWRVLVTLSGWFMLLLGLLRMFMASQYVQRAQRVSERAYMVLEGVLLLVGLFLTYRGWFST